MVGNLSNVQSSNPPGVENIITARIPESSTTMARLGRNRIETFTVLAIVPNLHTDDLPHFPFAVSGYHYDGMEISALVDAESPSEAAKNVENVFPVVRIQSVHQGVTASDELKWQGFLPSPEPEHKGIFGWFRRLFSKEV